MLRSSRTTAGCTRSAASNPARPPEAGTTEKPSSSRPAATVRRMASGSSARRTTGPAGPSTTLDDPTAARHVVLAIGDDPIAAGPAGHVVQDAVACAHEVVA